MQTEPTKRLFDKFPFESYTQNHFMCLTGLYLKGEGIIKDMYRRPEKLIEVCGKGGGYIMRTDTDYIQDAKPENVKTMIDSVEKYGRYH